MLSMLSRIFNDGTSDVRDKVVGIYTFLIAMNIGAWIWAFASFYDQPAMLGVALLAYTFGLRHAVDADHIAAIDNVTRKLMQEKKRPIAVGFFFSMGHLLVLLIGIAAIALTASTLETHFDQFNDGAGLVSTIMSTGFLLLIALMILMIAISVYRTFRHVRRGGQYADEDFDMLLNKRGLLARLFRPMFAFLQRSWHMAPLGFLFGLGFDTAAEVTLLGIASTQASHGMSLWPILTFPLLFAAGMSLVDTTDGIMMLGAYGWAFVKPIRKLYYNLTITLVSVVVALAVGGIEGLGLIGDEFSLKGWFWDNQDVYQLSAPIRCQFAPSVSARSACHNRQNHRADRPGRQRVDTSALWQAHAERGQAEQSRTQHQPGIADMEHQKQWLFRHGDTVPTQ